MGGVGHRSSEREARRNAAPIMREGETMTYNRMTATPMAGEHGRFCGDVSAS
jgi:hypothetical protein